jgi:leucyl aminopeptidase
MWAVGKGSRNDPYLVTLIYKGDPENKDNTLAIVGKGVCYDSGGLSIKTALTEIMHSDKGGACTSLGIF